MKKQQKQVLDEKQERVIDDKESGSLLNLKRSNNENNSEQNQTGFLGSPSPDKLNPLRQFSSVKWFQRYKTTSHSNYMNSVDQKQKIYEIQQLFLKFEENQSGYLRFEDIQRMFKTVGVELTVLQLQELFIKINNQEGIDPEAILNSNNSPSSPNKKSGKSPSKAIHFTKKKLTLNDFQHAMLSPTTNQKFKILMKQIRSQVRHNDFSNVKADVIFLPTDLSEMISFMYKKCIQREIQRSLNRSINETEDAMQSKNNFQSRNQSKLSLKSSNQNNDSYQILNKDLELKKSQQTIKRENTLQKYKQKLKSQNLATHYRSIDQRVQDSIQNFQLLLQGGVSEEIKIQNQEYQSSQNQQSKQLKIIQRKQVSHKENNQQLFSKMQSYLRQKSLQGENAYQFQTPKNELIDLISEVMIQNNGSPETRINNHYSKYTNSFSSNIKIRRQQIKESQNTGPSTHSKLLTLEDKISPQILDKLSYFPTTTKQNQSLQILSTDLTTNNSTVPITNKNNQVKPDHLTYHLGSQRTISRNQEENKFFQYRSMINSEKMRNNQLSQMSPNQNEKQQIQQIWTSHHNQEKPQLRRFHTNQLDKSQQDPKINFESYQQEHLTVDILKRNRFSKNFFSINKKYNLQNKQTSSKTKSESFHQSQRDLIQDLKQSYLNKLYQQKQNKQDDENRL